MKKSSIKKSNLNVINASIYLINNLIKIYFFSNTIKSYKILRSLIFIIIIFYVNTTNNQNNTIKIKIINSGNVGKLLNEKFFPNIMIINNDNQTFNNYIEPSGQNFTLIWNETNETLGNCCEGMFFTNDSNSIIEEIDLSNFNANISTMKNMFLNQTKLKRINISSNNEVNDMYGMFQNCTSLESIDLSSFNFGGKNNMSYMFFNCKNLSSIIPPDSSSKEINVLEMDHMFSFCENLTSIDLSSFIINQNSNFNCMFCNDYSLESVNLPNIKASIFIDMNSMFDSCSNLNNITFNANSKININNADKAFNNCSSLQSLNLSMFSFSCANSSRYMFNNCSSLINLTLNNDSECTNEN